MIRFGCMETYHDHPGDEVLKRLSKIMSADHVDIEVELGTGQAEATVFGCDLSAGYIRINADYTT